MQNVFAMEEGLDLLLLTGFRKAVSSLTLGDCSCLVNALLDFHLMGRVKMDAVKENVDLFKPFFVSCKKELTPGN